MASATVPSFTIERYQTRPENGPTCPPGSMSVFWPTGFAGTGWLVRKDGEVVYAHAWREFCGRWVEAQS